MPHYADTAGRKVPLGGVLAHLCYKGRVVGDPARKVIRDIMRQDALAQWKLRGVQGKVARASPGVYTPCLDARWYTKVCARRDIQAWLLDTDTEVATGLAIDTDTAAMSPAAHD